MYEHVQNKSLNEQLHTEQNQVMKIVNHLNPDLTLNDVKIMRLGIYTRNAAIKKFNFSTDKTKRKKIGHCKRL